MKNKRFHILLLVILLIPLFLSAQNDFPYGRVKVDYFTIKEYNSVAQNWDCVQGPNGFLYFANNSNPMVYDGENWYKLKFPNDVTCKSINMGKDGVIYVGGDDEFGFIEYNEKGKMVYHSLRDKIKRKDLNEFWYTHVDETTGYIHFASRNSYLIYNPEEQTFNDIETPKNIDIEKVASNGFKHILSLGDEDREDKEYYELHNNKLHEIKFIPETRADTINSNIIGVFQHQQKSYIAFTEKMGAFLLQPGAEEHSYRIKNLSKMNLFRIGHDDYKISSVAFQNGIYALGLSGGFDDGISLYNQHGKFIRNFSENDGLINLEIHNTYFDRDGNLWSCNDNGLAKIELSSPITSFSKEQGLFNAIEDLAFLNNQLYIAARGDLLTTKINDQQRMEIIRTGLVNEETYDIEKVTINDKDELFIVGLNGLYAVNDKAEGRKLNSALAWKLFQAEPNDKTVYVGLDAEGLGRMEYINGEWVYPGIFRNTEGNVRNIDVFRDTIFYGITKLGLSFHDVNLPAQEKILDIPGEVGDPLEYFVKRFQDKLFVGTENGLFIKEGNKLVPFEFMNGFFSDPEQQIFRIHNSNDEKLWIEMIKKIGEVEKIEVGYLEHEDGEYSWTSLPFKELTEDVIKTFIEDNNGIYWFGGENKLYTYNPKAYNNISNSFEVFVTQFSLLPDSTIAYNLHHWNQELEPIDFSSNSIKVQVAAPVYYGKDKTMYRFKLEGYDEDWTPYSLRSEIAYQKLPEGKYTLKIQARSYYGVESEVTELTFEILPPWYRTWWAYTLYVVLAILLIYIAIRLSVQRVKKQNERLEMIVDERTAEIANKNKELEHQKVEIEEKNKDITDSIIYAKRIQNTILPSKERLNQYFNDYFVLYKPKDIVSGDFYWSVEKNGKYLFSAVDCTGHGVPGAFVSLVGSNSLNRCVNEFNLIHPNEILDQLRELVVEAFAQEGSTDVKDGMDIALCSIDFEKGELEYAGANNALYILRKGELLETKADKQPIGAFEHSKPFTNNVIKLEKGDRIYVFSDGYVDQFGGPKGKKFKSKAFKDILCEIYDMPMQEQKKVLDKTIVEWQGNLEQIDDICVFGVKY